MNSKGFNRAMVACLWIVLAFMYIPIIAIIGMSFNATPYGMFPYVFTFDWYKILFTESNLLPACVFSLKFAFGVTVAAIIIGTMASFGLQAYSPKWSNRLNALIQLPIIIPWLVTAISLLLLFSFVGAGRSMVSMLTAISSSLKTESEETKMTANYSKQTGNFRITLNRKEAEALGYTSTSYDTLLTALQMWPDADCFHIYGSKAQVAADLTTAMARA